MSIKFNRGTFRLYGKAKAVLSQGIIPPTPTPTTTSTVASTSNKQGETEISSDDLFK